MLKMKKHKTQAFKVISHAVNDSIKAAEHKIVDIKDFIEPGITEVQYRLSKHPISAGLALLGIGIAIVGSMKLLKK